MNPYHHVARFHSQIDDSVSNPVRVAANYGVEKESNDRLNLLRLVIRLFGNAIRKPGFCEAANTLELNSIGHLLVKGKRATVEGAAGGQQVDDESREPEKMPPPADERRGDPPPIVRLHTPFTRITRQEADDLDPSVRALCIPVRKSTDLCVCNSGSSVKKEKYVRASFEGGSKIDVRWDEQRAEICVIIVSESAVVWTEKATIEKEEEKRDVRRLFESSSESETSSLPELPNEPVRFSPANYEPYFELPAWLAEEWTRRLACWWSLHLAVQGSNPGKYRPLQSERVLLYVHKDRKTERWPGFWMLRSKYIPHRPTAFAHRLAFLLLQNQQAWSSGLARAGGKSVFRSTAGKRVAPYQNTPKCQFAPLLTFRAQRFALRV